MYYNFTIIYINSDSFWRKKEYQLNTIIQNFSLSQIFYTMTMGEGKSKHLHEILKKQIMVIHFLVIDLFIHIIIIHINYNHYINIYEKIKYYLVLENGIIILNVMNFKIEVQYILME